MRIDRWGPNEFTCSAAYSLVQATRCCTSRHVTFGLRDRAGNESREMSSRLERNQFAYFASRTRATMPAARGAAADVPVWSSVHASLSSVVACKQDALVKNSR